jgi:hypothetical protein
VEKIPFGEAVGTAAKPTEALCVGITMLVVEPESPMDPLLDSFVVSTICTAFVPESKTSRVARVAEMAMSPGTLNEPAPTGATRGRLSFFASTMTKPGNDDPASTLCEARTRVVRPLGGGPLGLEYPLQERKQVLAVKRTLETRTAFFKREAPNDLKSGDLSAK